MVESVLADILLLKTIKRNETISNPNFKTGGKKAVKCDPHQKSGNKVPKRKKLQMTKAIPTE